MGNPIVTNPALTGVDAHDAAGITANAAKFKSQGDSFVAQYIDEFSDASTGGSPSVTAAQIKKDVAAGLDILSIFQTNGMSSSSGAAYQTYFTRNQGSIDGTEALQSAEDLGQPEGSTIYFAFDFDPAVAGSQGEMALLKSVQTYIAQVSQVFKNSGYKIGVYGAGDTLAAVIRNTFIPPGSPAGTKPVTLNTNYTPVSTQGWLTQSYGWAGSDASDANSQGWALYQQYPSTTQNGVDVDVDKATTTDLGQWACYVEGTRIRVARGDVAVEDLAVGDLAITASGALRPIRWLGHRAVDCRHHPRPTEARPVRIAAHAFGENRPARDLSVSPGHALCVDVVGEVLIPAVALVNGCTVVQEEVDIVTYWHVELDGHDVILAENMPAESYIDTGNRGFFAESDVVALDARPDAGDASHADFCRPFHGGGALVDAVRAQLTARARGFGWRLSEPERLGDLHLTVDGRRIDPVIRGLQARFALPADARDVWLVSSAAVPQHVGHADDGRLLGAYLGALAIDDGFAAPRVVRGDDPRLCCGFHEAEANGCRWTAGRARLPATLWADAAETFYLRVDLACAPLPVWTEPTASLNRGRASAA